MRIVTWVVAASLLLALGWPQLMAQQQPAGKAAPQAAAERTGPKLQIGDAAPALQVGKWLQGEPVKAFQKDSVYVVEFWATWCGPCIASMPHLDELAQKFQKQGLVVVALTTEDEANSSEAVTEFVQGDGAKYHFRYAFCDDNKMMTQYMEAAEQQGIPCSFVVGKDGKVAFIGHPSELDQVLPQVLDGTWSVEKAQQMAAAQQKFNSVITTMETDPVAALATLEEIAQANPAKAQADDFQSVRMICLALAKKYDELIPVAEAQLAKMNKAEDGMGLISLAGILMSVNAEAPHPKLAEMGKKALDKALALESKSPEVLMMAAQFYALSGNREKALEYGKKAVELAPDDLQELLKAELKQLEALSLEKLQRGKESDQEQEATTDRTQDDAK